MRTRPERRPSAARVRGGRTGRSLFGHIMVPIDLSERNARALSTALGLAADLRARVTLFHVIDRVPGIPPGELDAFYRRLVERSERTLRRAARRFAERGIRVGTEVRIGEPAREIVRAALSRRVDLVVMGSHKVRPGRPALGWGTTSYKAGIFCPCPILLMK